MLQETESIFSSKPFLTSWGHTETWDPGSVAGEGGAGPAQKESSPRDRGREAEWESHDFPKTVVHTRDCTASGQVKYRTPS